MITTASDSSLLADVIGKAVMSGQWVRRIDKGALGKSRGRGTIRIGPNF